MSVIIRHPVTDKQLTVANNEFFPDIDVSSVRREYTIDDRTDDQELIRIIQSNLMRVNDDLNAWVCDKLAQGYNTLEAVPAAQLGDDSVLSLSYQQAVCYGVKADVMRAKLDYDLTAKGDQEADEREDKAMHYTAEATRALRRLLGRGHISVKRIKTKNNKNSPLDSLVR